MMFLLNIRTRTVTIERLIASHLRSSSHSTRSASSQTRSLSLLSSNSTALTSFPIPPRPRRTERRTYAVGGTEQNTAQGTIGKGASGVEDEARRERDSLQAPDHLNEQELMIFEKLETAFEPVRLEVQDISGGCGSMYGIEIVSERFRGLSMLKQQRLVNEVLGDEIKGWHGVQLKTKVP